MADQNRKGSKNATGAPSAKQQESQRIQKLTTYTGAAVVVGLLLVVILYTLLNRSGSSAFDFNLEAQPFVGDPAAPVKIVEFGDFKCPACKQFHDVTFTQLKKDYVDTGKAVVYFLQFPIPEVTGFDSINASNAAECFYKKSNTLFWSFFDKIYFNQPPEEEAWALPDNLMQIIKDLNVDPNLNEEELRNCITNKTYEQDIIADRELGLKAGVRGTPTIFVNGKLASGNYPSLKRIIDAELGQ